MAIGGILIRAEVDSRSIRAKLHELISLGQDPSEALRDIATYGENSTRERFRMQIGPDGNRWKPSLRVQLRGGKTLTKDGHLSGSISRRSGRTFAEWGTNRVYGPAMQLGFDGTVNVPAHTREITSAFGRKLKSGVTVSVRAYSLRQKIVARPYLGVNEENAADIMDLLADRIDGAR
ncbi:MAG: phage virion morphogenesis protein [Pseudomonadota bacterium]